MRDTITPEERAAIKKGLTALKRWWTGHEDRDKPDLTDRLLDDIIDAIDELNEASDNAGRG